MGAAAAQALAARDHVARVLLVDAAARVATGKALDIQQSGAVDGFHTQLDATDDVTAVATSAVCVIADRAGAPSTEWRGEEGLAMVVRLLQFTGAPIVFAGAAHADVMQNVWADLKVGPYDSGLVGADVYVGPRRRLIGSAPEAFASAMRAVVALEARCSPGEVVLSVLGAPPAGLVVPWSEASIGGYALERVLTPVQITRLEARAARLWPPGPCTLGLAAAQVAEAIVTSSRRTFSALALLGGEFGVRNRVGAVPVQFSPRGIAEVRVPSLSTRERVLVETALGGA